MFVYFPLFLSNTDYKPVAYQAIFRQVSTHKRTLVCTCTSFVLIECGEGVSEHGEGGVVCFLCLVSSDCLNQLCLAVLNFSNTLSYHLEAALNGTQITTTPTLFLASDSQYLSPGWDLGVVG